MKIRFSLLLSATLIFASCFSASAAPKAKPRAGSTPGRSNSASAIQSDPRFFLRASDRVLFYGDSITEHRFYTMFVESFVLTRFPTWRLRFYNAGWGGDKVTGGPDRPIDVRLNRDVIAYQPTVITSMLGMNDAGWRSFDSKLFGAYAQGYEHIADVFQKSLPRTRVTLLRPSPFDDITQPPRFEGGYNEVLKRYGDFVASLAQKRNMSVADLNGPVVKALELAAREDEEAAQKIMGDRAHPAPAGHLLMAMSLLEAWSAPSVVSGVEINIANLRAVRVDNTSVSQLRFTPFATTDAGPKIVVSAAPKTEPKDPKEDDKTATLSWVQKDRALPFPLNRNDATMNLALRSSDFDARLNNQTLRVLGLRESSYRLQINGKRVGNFGAKELAEGINLALYQTPMMAQAQNVHALTLQRNRVQYAAWRHVRLPLADINSPKYGEVLRALGSMENDLITKQRLASQPVSCVYELTPIPTPNISPTPTAPVPAQPALPSFPVVPEVGN